MSGPSEGPLTWVADADALDDVVAALSSEPRYAIDTEFHRERSYYAQVALVQLAWPGHLVLVDPLAVDIAPLGAVLSGPGLAVVHAAEQDLEVLDRACGDIPSRIFDTQVAAGFIGMSSPSLGSLVERLLDVRLAKGDRVTDWNTRPLTPEQTAYAASDVAHLLDLHDVLTAKLVARNRLHWAEDEFENLRVRRRGGQPPETAWWRIKDARNLRGRSRGVAQEVSAWRERAAAALDRPVRTVLPDLALLSIAHRPPADREQLRRVRGLDGRTLRSGLEGELLDAIRRGLDLPADELLLPPTDDLERTLRPAATLVSAWVSQLARDEDLDPAMLATRADLHALLAGSPDARLTTGWRGALVGEPIRRLVAGEAALAFDGKGGLVLEPRGGDPGPGPGLG